MHTVLGANGVIGQELSRALAEAVPAIRQVGRQPVRVNPADQLVAADLLDGAATSSAVAGSAVVYLVAGLKYDASVWHEQWPRLMYNVIDACKRHGARLVFFDNVYAYGRVTGAMTEATPFNPVSRKGEVRARIATMLLDEMRGGGLHAMIVRSAEAYGQTWHLPTTREALGGAGFARLACQLAGQPGKLQLVPRWARKFMGVFVPALRENEEMMYQLDFDYRFDSSKIESAFALAATPYRQGIAESLR